MFADVPQEIQKTHRLGPGGIVEQAGWIGFGFEVEQASELLFHAGDVGVEHLPGKQLPLLRLKTWIADGSRGAPSQRNRMMALKLKTPKSKQGHKIAHV